MNKIDYCSFNWLILKINNQVFQAQRSKLKGRVIDLGCGSGQYKDAILATAHEYIGVDWPCSLHENRNIDVFADLNKRLPFDDNYADAIVSFQVMEHLAEPAFFLSECGRILRPGCPLIITVPFMWHIHEAPHDYFRFTRYGLDYMLQQAGFSHISITENTGFWQMMVLKFNYHTLRFARGPLKFIWIPLWWFGQVVSPFLDRFDKHPEETASYTVIARKT